MRTSKRKLFKSPLKFLINILLFLFTYMRSQLMFLEFVLFKKDSAAFRKLTSIFGIHESPEFILFSKGFGVHSLLFQLFFRQGLVGTLALFEVVLAVEFKAFVLDEGFLAVADVTFESAFCVVAVHVSYAS